MYDSDPSKLQKEKWQLEQDELRTKLILDDSLLTFDPVSLNGLDHVGGVDLSFPLNDDENAVACLVVMSFPDLKIIYQDYLETKLYLPYISGYLAFREVEPLMTLITRLKETRPDIYPQVILVDGNGIHHPRQFGNASHLGVLAQTPTIGVAKNFLVVKDELDYSPAFKAQLKKELLNRGDRFDLIGESSGKLYGAALINAELARNPVFVSQGHAISLDTALSIVVATSLHRIPEPIRSADLGSRSYIKSIGK